MHKSQRIWDLTQGKREEKRKGGNWKNPGTKRGGWKFITAAGVAGRYAGQIRSLCILSR